jgi:transketolase
MNKTILLQAANEARGLAIDAVHACNSGHLGLPLGAAEIGAVLFSEALSIDPTKPDWLNRDRFILSAGHGSMFLYSWLHLSGFDVSLEDLKNFRKFGSKTPGHPEFGAMHGAEPTPGVEATTGPLGQGVGNAVGMAVSAKMAAARYNTDAHPIFDHHIVALAGDGCLQEGVAAEASAFAGHFGLDNLILIYDANDVTLDAMAEATQSEDAAARYRAFGFDVVTLADGHDLEAFAKAYAEARDNDNGKPKLIIAKTLIGKGIDAVAGTAKAHGEGGAKFATEARAGLGLPESTFYVSDSVREYFASLAKCRAEKRVEWEKLFADWQAANPEKAAELESGLAPLDWSALSEKVPAFESGKALATRAAGETIINALAKAVPNLVSGSADLHGSTKNYLKDMGDFSRDNPAGRNLLFGIREHAMGAIMNGFAYHGLFRASGATFLTFSDYMRPSVRLAALVGLPVFYIWTHDSVGVGEDGPTHQPVETVSGLRAIPNLDVIRPADSEEAAAAFCAALSRHDGPTALILTRQNVPALDALSVAERREGVLKGGYIAKRESASLERILIATGSEVQHALKAAEQLGESTRVVSMPCCERFERQSAEYRESVLPANCSRRVAIEAGVSHGWHRYVGLAGKTVCIDSFGLSAPGDEVMKHFGIDADNLAKVAASV